MEECAHPYKVLADGGVDITICSVNGGDCTVNVDPDSMNLDADEVKKGVWEDAAFQEKIKSTPALSAMKGTDFNAVFAVGGFGVMFDMYKNAEIGRVGREVYESGGMMAAVCHGPIALANIFLSDGTALVKDKTVTGFSNAEEDIVKIPIPKHDEGSSCEDVLTHLGCKYTKAEAVFGACAVEDNRVISGQNPASADGVGKLILQGLTA